MIHLGQYNTLSITRFTDHGAYLDGGDVGEILMPKAYIKPEMRPGDTVRVFLYLDQSERLVGTTEIPLATVGTFAYLRVSWVNEYGAFLDWGLMKDLFVPFREQKMRMEQGRSYIVYVGIDPETHRIIGTAKIDHLLSPATSATYYRGREVEVLVQQKTPLGFKVIVENAHPGLLYDDQIFGPVPRTGDLLRATVTQLRPDGKLDLSVGRIGKSRFRDFASVLLDELSLTGELPFTDKSLPEDIAARFGVSKKTFKQALGSLYRDRKVELLDDRIRLVKRGTPRG